jgi:hypothetical protein
MKERLTNGTRAITAHDESAEVAEPRAMTRKLCTLWVKNPCAGHSAQALPRPYCRLLHRCSAANHQKALRYRRIGVTLFLLTKDS